MKKHAAIGASMLALAACSSGSSETGFGISGFEVTGSWEGVIDPITGESTTTWVLRIRQNADGTIIGNVTFASSDCWTGGTISGDIAGTTVFMVISGSIRVPEEVVVSDPGTGTGDGTNGDGEASPSEPETEIVINEENFTITANGKASENSMNGDFESTGGPCGPLAGFWSAQRI